MSYEMATGAFSYRWVIPTASQEQSSGSPSVHDPPRSGHVSLTARETEIFLPAMLTRGRKVTLRGLEGDDTWVHDEARQTLYILPKDNSPGSEHLIEITVDPPLELFIPNDFWSDFGLYLKAAFAGVLALLLIYVVR